MDLGHHPLGLDARDVLYPDACTQLDISYDSFVRTTDAKHEALVSAVLERVWQRGDIYKSDYEGFYCVDCEEYKARAGDLTSSSRVGPLVVADWKALCPSAVGM